MDAYIDTKDIEEGIRSLSSIVTNLKDCIVFMESKLRAAGLEFTSINFERASSSAELASSSLDEMGEKLAITQRYLAQLIEDITEYDHLRY